MPPNTRPRRVVHSTYSNSNTTRAAQYEVGDILVDDTGQKWIVTESPTYDGTTAGGSTVQNGWIK